MKHRSFWLFVAVPLDAVLALSSVAGPQSITSLTSLVVQGMQSQLPQYAASLDESQEERLLQLCDELNKDSKGFSTDLLEGTWVNVLQVSKKPSSHRETKVNFDAAAFKVQFSTLTPHGNGHFDSIMSYKPTGAGYTLDSNGKIVLRRIELGKPKASFKYKSLPRLRIPFRRRKKAWLDFVYLDEDICISRDSNDVTFVYVREEFLENALQDESLAAPNRDTGDKTNRDISLGLSLQSRRVIGSIRSRPGSSWDRPFSLRKRTSLWMYRDQRHGAHFLATRPYEMHRPHAQTAYWAKETNDDSDDGNEAQLQVIQRGSSEDQISDELWAEMEAGQPSELNVMKEILGINIFTYILAGLIGFFLTMNAVFGQGWLGNVVGIPGTGTFTERSDKLPSVVDLSDDKYSI